VHNDEPFLPAVVTLVWHPQCVCLSPYMLMPLCYAERSSTVVSFTSGALAGAAATVASYPFDLLRTTLAAQGEPKVGDQALH
jgi:hypothetical protein